MKTFAYDIETYPNYHSAVFVNIEDENDIYEFVLYKNRNDTQALVQFIQQNNLRLVGFNSRGYDNILLKALLSATQAITNRKLYNLSKYIIENKTRDYKPYVKRLYYDNTPFESVDLMELVSINTIRPSLKSCAIHLKYDLIQDLPLDPDKPIKDKDIELMLKYNLNDVKATRLLYLQLLPDIELREKLGKQYDVDLLSASDSKIAKTVLDSAYGIPIVKATERHEIPVKDLLPKNLVFNSKYLKKFLSRLKEKTLISGVSKIKESVAIGGITCTLAQGGIHSEDAPGVFESDDEYVLIDSDVASYYPNIILLEGVIPQHLDKDRFWKLYKELIETRIKAKREGDKTTADTLKISINSTFGLMGFPYYWLFDPKCMYQVTIAGQLYLIDLAEKLLQDPNNQLISMNTDGVLFRVKKDSLGNYMSICESWEKRTGFELEHNEYKLYARRDVNNYMSVDYKDKIKTKGIFSDGLRLNKRTFVTAYNSPIIALALQAYFKDGIDPQTTVDQERDIHNFLFSEKTDKKFKMFAEKVARGKIIREELQKTNRWLVSKKGYRLKKYHQYGGKDVKKMVDCNVILANDINEVSLADVDKEYYVNETWKIIYEIEGKKPVEQMGLF